MHPQALGYAPGGRWPAPRPHSPGCRGGARVRAPARMRPRPPCPCRGAAGRSRPCVESPVAGPAEVNSPATPRGRQQRNCETGRWHTRPRAREYLTPIGSFAASGRQSGKNFTGQYYTLWRHYDPALMRFTGPDPIASPWWNLNGYCLNNPAGGFDPDGLGPVGEFFGNCWRGGSEWVADNVFGGEGPGAGIALGVGDFAGGMVDFAMQFNIVAAGADSVYALATWDFDNAPLLLKNRVGQVSRAIDRWNGMDEAGFGFFSKVGRTLAFNGMDMLGTTGLFEAMAGYDSVTQEDLSSTERWRRGTTTSLGAIAQLAGAKVAGGRVGGGKAPTPRPNPTPTRGGGCFLEGTQIAVASGLVAIETLCVGDEVLACDPETMTWSWQPVTKTHRYDYDGDIVTVTVGSEQVEATGNHPFWVISDVDLEGRAIAKDALETGCRFDPAVCITAVGRWVEARDLQTGDRLWTYARGVALVSHVSSRNERITVYNLTVAHLHTYAVGTSGILVHNTSRITPVQRGGPKGVDSSHHNANVMVRDAGGQKVFHQRFVSGSMTPDEAALGFPRNTLATHTEARAVGSVPLARGDTMTITGQRPPCFSCRGKMNRRAAETGAKIIYRWRENGVTRKWQAGKKGKG